MKTDIQTMFMNIPSEDTMTWAHLFSFPDQVL